MYMRSIKIVDMSIFQKFVLTIKFKKFAEIYFVFKLLLEYM